MALKARAALSPLITDHLVMRTPRADDAEPIFERYAADPAVTRFLVWRPHESVEDTRTFLKQCAQAWSKRTELPWVITLRGDDRPVGMITLRPSDDFKASIGFVLAKEHWGRGLMTEALTTIVTFALGPLGFYRAWSFCDVENEASGRVMQKAGMKYEGTLRRFAMHPNVSDTPRDVDCYAKVRAG